ncbi:MAG: archaeal proteasome endopeptidase complex subunit beta [Candidatus Bathyarchaeia archaeon]
MTNNDEVNRLTLKGTTTVGVVCKDGVIMASDTRVTMGFYVAHKHGKKVYQIDDHLAMTIAGSLADAQKAVDILTTNAKLYKIELGRPLPISSAARLLSNLLFSARYVPLLAQVLVGGLDDTGPHIFSIDPFGSLTEEKYVSTGSGSPVAYGILEEKYKDDVPVREMLPVIVKAVDAAMKRDSASGDSFNVAVIDVKGYRDLTDKEKKQLLAD